MQLFVKGVPSPSSTDVHVFIPYMYEVVMLLSKLPNVWPLHWRQPLNNVCADHLSANEKCYSIMWNNKQLIKKFIAVLFFFLLLLAEVLTWQWMWPRMILTSPWVVICILHNVMLFCPVWPYTLSRIVSLHTKLFIWLYPPCWRKYHLDNMNKLKVEGHPRQGPGETNWQTLPGITEKQNQHELVLKSQQSPFAYLFIRSLFRLVFYVIAKT